MPLLSNLNDEMPDAARAKASCCKLLFFILGLFPFLSVGPEPAIIKTTGPFVNGIDVVIVPKILPVGVSSIAAVSIWFVSVC